MIKVYCNGTRIQCLRQGELTVGMAGAPIEFDFSEEWNGLTKIAVFRCDGARDVLLSESGEAIVPHEILTVPGMDVEVGVHAIREDGTTWPSPTTYCKIGRVKAGADPTGDESYPPTPDIGQQVIKIATRAADIAEDVERRANAGEFDGEKGDPGVGVASVEQTVKTLESAGENIFKVNLTNGESSSFSVYNGHKGDKGDSVKGDKGDPGVSPEISTKKIEGGTEVEVKDAFGTKKFNVKDGKNGADGLTTVVDENGNNVLYLMVEGQAFGEGVTIPKGGGGGGGASNNAILTMKNESGWITKTIALGAECPVTFTWSSLEDGIPTGSGVLRISTNNSQKHVTSVNQGTITIDVAPYVSAGENAVSLSVSDTYGNARNIVVNITVVSVSLKSDFDNTIPYTGAFNYIYTPVGAAEKTVHFKLDGKEIATATVTVSGRQQTQPIPAQSHGSHTLEVYFTAVINGETVPSNTLFYELICLEDGNNTPVIASDFNAKTAEQYDSIVIPYRVYNPASMTANITLDAPDLAAAKPLTVDRSVQKWTYRPDTQGKQVLTITCGDAVKRFELTVTESDIDVEAETDSLSLYLSSYGRSNNEENPAQWVSGNVAATFENYNFVSDGWITDAEGITALRTTGDARLTIPLKIFEKDFRSTGKTIELDFATRDILNYDAVILSCWSENRGLQLTAQRALLKSEASAISTQYKEDEHVRISFVVQKRSGFRLLQVYINGILSGVVQYPDNADLQDDFSQSNPVNITVGSNDCTIDLYTIRVYDNDLTRYQILDNWIADTQLAAVKNERWSRNEVFDEYGQIVIGQLPKDLPYLIINAETLPQFKGNKITVSGEYVDPVDSSRSFTFANAEADVQGTSSATYARKNYKIKFNGGFTQNGANIPNYQLRPDSIPTNVFTFKADVASSEGANNVELVKLYNDTCPYKTPPQLVNPDVRQGIDGYPIVIFQNNGRETIFIGKYNFNNDKASPEVFGFNDGDESWEIRNNTSDRVVWKNDDFSGTDWLNDFEGRYPDGNTDPTNLAALSSWIKSTDTTGLSESEKAARLAKFKAELPNWMDVDSTLFYYLFTELFLMVDSRAKNAFPTRYDNGVWCWLPYDMDTALGINNEGALVFGYQLEDTDKTSAGEDVYNGQNSVLWNNVREAFKDELMEMYQELRSSNTISYADTEARFEEHQEKWPAAIFNEDAYYKYLEPLIVDNDASYLGMLQGSKAEQRKWWLYNRFRYMDSKYNAGDALTDIITLRGYKKSDITVTPYADIYATIKYGSYLVQKRALRGGSYTLECPLDNVNDTETYIYSASQLADIGDLSGYQVGYANFTYGTKLQSLKVGDASASYSNPSLIELYLGNNKLLKTLDVRNCPNLGIGANKEGAVQTSVDASGCSNIEHVYFDGTSIKALSLPNGGAIKTLHLPGTITNLTIRNQTAITDFVLPNYSNITTLRLENVSNAVPVADILAAIPAGSRVRLIGFDWSFDSAADIVALCDKLDTMRGLDESGNNTDKAQVSGTVRVKNIVSDQLLSITSRYPDINVVYDNLAVYVFFYDETGENLLQTVEGAVNGSVVYTGATPTKESSAQYDYTFAGWSRTIGGAAEEGILNNIGLGGNFYAVFTATVRTFTVRFFNGTTLLDTVPNVPYGAMAGYTGDTPVKGGVDNPADYEFIGWLPDPIYVTEDMDCYAQFKNNSIYTWESVSAAIADGTYKDVYKVGDLVPIDLGTYGVHDMQIVAFDADDKADGNGKAPITWISKTLIAEQQMNTTGTNNGGWADSYLRSWLKSDVYNAIPSDVKNAIVTVNKTYRRWESSANDTFTINDDVWIPSHRELTGVSECENDGVDYADFFTDNASRIKHYKTSTGFWWNRSATNSGGAKFAHVDRSGVVKYNGTPNSNYGVALGFCT